MKTVLFFCFLFLAAMAWGQSSLPVPDPVFGGKVGRTIRDSDAPTFPAAVRPPRGAPNIVLVMLDDVGFGQYSVFGGAVPSPALERLAREGLRYNRFHTAGICSPSRAALLTGRNPHKAGFGNVAELSTGYDGYSGVIPRSTATVAEVLRQHGYATAMFGKNHNTPSWEGGPAGPFNHWPTGLGFEYFYGFNGWGTSQWQPALFENTRPVAPSSDPRYQLTADLVDHAIAWMHNVKTTSGDQPFFLYMAPGATHAPHHAPPEWIARFKGQFAMGWDEYRRITFERQKKLGVIPADAQLTARPSLIQAWDTYSQEQRRLLAHEMEVFAAFGAYADHEVGRLLDAVRELPDANNTLVIYVVGDNGASAEGGPLGEVNEIAAANGVHADFTPEVTAGLGGPLYNNHFARGWAWAMNTPFKYYKQLVSHLGAIRNPLIVSWPERIKQPGGLRTQFYDIVDIAPTLLDAAGIAMPEYVNGIGQKRLDGTSMLSSFTDAHAPESRATQYFEVFGNRGIYHEGWFASAPLELDPGRPDRSARDPDKVSWELYDLSTDFSQGTDLAEREPARLRALQDLWWAEAAKNDVLPLDWRAGERLAGIKRPGSVAEVKHFSYYPGLVGLPESIAPNLRNRSWKILARGQFSPQAQGMLITQGGNPGGWALYIQNGRLVFDYNYAQAAHYRVESQPLPAHSTSLEARFRYDGRPGKDLGAGGELTLWSDNVEIGTGRLEKTLKFVFSVLEGLDVGADYGSPVSDRYPFPFPFHAGELRCVSIDLE
jgi:arylsulfatase